MITEEHVFTFAKDSQRNLGDRAVANQSTALLAQLNNKNIANQGWTFEPDRSEHESGWVKVSERPDPSDPTKTVKTSHMFLRLSFAHTVKEPDKNMVRAQARKAYNLGIQPNYGLWTLVDVDGTEYFPPDENGGGGFESADAVGYADVTLPAEDEFNAYFDHLYGLDHQISRMWDAVVTAERTNYEVRTHTLFVGPPGCGKTQVALALQKMFGEDAVLKFDGPATTNVGIQKVLADLEILPRFIVVEEMEKAPESASQVFLGMMDDRAEIRKVTARTNIQRDTRVLVIATVNSLTALRKLHYGALASRFSNAVGFKRPSREQLAMILTREISRFGLDERWIAPCLNYCVDRGITDPRRVITLCLNGADKWLRTDAEGVPEYVRVLEATDVEDVDQIANWADVDLTINEDEDGGA